MVNQMKAIILAGGRGTRLSPITDYIPKSLIPIKNIPIIEWQIKYLKKFGVTEIIICAGYKSKILENFLTMKNDPKVKITFSVEKTPLGTGGAIKQTASLIKEKSFFVLNGDVITNIDLHKLAEKPNSIASITSSFDVPLIAILSRECAVKIIFLSIYCIFNLRFKY